MKLSTNHHRSIIIDCRVSSDSSSLKKYIKRIVILFNTLRINFTIFTLKNEMVKDYE